MLKSAVAALAGALFALVGTVANADQVPVAVAANFTEPAKEIAAAFKARTGHQAVLSFGASGQFYSQISHGAPFQVFLSADVERARKAEAEGFAVRGTEFTYARGQLALYSKTPGLVDGKGEVLKGDRFQKLSIADPAAAPYGRAAVETLTALKLLDKDRPKIVQGSSITQAYQFVDTGAAEIGFVALSQVVALPGGSRWIVPEHLHKPIDQGAVLLKTGESAPAAKAFMSFLKGPEARAIIRKFGYVVP